MSSTQSVSALLTRILPSWRALNHLMTPRPNARTNTLLRRVVGKKKSQLTVVCFGRLWWLVVELSWLNLMLLFIFTYIGSWTLFALAWHWSNVVRALCLAAHFGITSFSSCARILPFCTLVRRAILDSEPCSQVRGHALITRSGWLPSRRPLTTAFLSRL